MSSSLSSSLSSSTNKSTQDRRTVASVNRTTTTTTTGNTRTLATTRHRPLFLLPNNNSNSNSNSNSNNNFCAQVLYSTHNNFLPFVFTNCTTRSPSTQELDLYLTHLLIELLLQSYPFEEEEKEETEEGNNSLFTALSGDYFKEESSEYNKNNIESYTMSSHQIDYSHPVVKEFLSHMDTCFQSAIMGDADAKIYDSIWFQLGNKGLATVYLTVMLAKLLLTEQKALEKRQKGKETETYGTEGENNTSISDADFNEDNVSIQEVCLFLHLFPCLSCYTHSIYE